MFVLSAMVLFLLLTLLVYEGAVCLAHDELKDGPGI